jgi:fibronectin type 3 domain-containing protein
LELDSQVQRAIVYGNSFEDGGVTNNMISTTFAVAWNLTSASPPAALQATAGNQEATLAWSAPLGATSYIVRRALVAGGPYSVNASVTSTNYTDIGLTNGVTYYYVVAAVRSGNDSGNSAEVNATPRIPPPSVPADLTAAAGNDQVVLTWASSSGATSYNVKQALGPGSPYIMLTNIDATNYTSSGLSNGVTYYYMVSALNMGGESTNSLSAYATPLGPLPAIPTGLTVTAANGQAILNWTAVAGATGYYLKRALVSGGPYAVIAYPVSHGWTDSIVANYRVYYYVVSAIDSSGQSANSVEVSVTPQPPLQLSVTWQDESQLLLSWPGWASNYNLYSAANLSLSAWQPVTNSLQDSNGAFNLSLPISSNTQQFFRLFGP